MHANWKNLTTIAQLDIIDETSESKPVVIFKHSTRCGISAGAEYRLLADWGYETGDIELYHLDLLKHRDVSNAVAERYKVVHQSPQLLMIVDGKAVDDTSHHLVSSDFIDKNLSQSKLV